MGKTLNLERVAGIEPAPSAWKAEVLPLNYTRQGKTARMVEGEGFEPSKAEPSDLQSDPFDRSGTPPIGLAGDYVQKIMGSQPLLSLSRSLTFNSFMARG